MRRVRPTPALAALALVTLASASCSRAHAPSGNATGAIDAGAAALSTPPPAPRPPEVIRREGNHLTGAGSIYLRQHAHNPVDWYPWSPEALARARAEDRPIFLSIGYSSCHWCHVMEDEVFEKDEVATFVNAHFIAIKVDREERPDLDDAYMQVLLSMNGNGGWPMSLFLTPSLKPFFGATYLPHDRFLTVASKVAEQYATARADLETRAEDIQRRIAREDTGATSAPPLEPAAIHAMATAALERFDPQNGGFGGPTKFPTPVRWELVLHAARKWGDAPLKDALRVTLDHMAAGGIRDPIGGGFHRYSTDARWEVPHFEKMLYDNAQLATLYLEAGRALGERRYVDVAVDTLDFLLREMQGKDGGFCASFDADSAGREGAYYVWTKDELRAVAGADDGEVLARLLGVAEHGTFDGASVVSRAAPVADITQATHRTEADLERLWAAARPKLLAARERRTKLRADTKIVTAWNGLALRALASGFDATGDARYRDAALRAADFLWRVHHGGDSALHRASNDGHASEAGVLEDYAFLADGMLALFTSTGRRDLLEHALELVKAADARFLAPDGGWYGATRGATPFAPRVTMDDAVEPSGSAVMMHVRIALAALTLQRDLTPAVDDALRGRASAVRAEGLGAAGWWDAALLRVGPFYDVVIAGDDAGAVARLADVGRALAPAWAVTVRVPGEGADAAFTDLVGAARDKTRGAAPARAFVCQEGACQAPTADPATLRAQIRGGWAF